MSESSSISMQNVTPSSTAQLHLERKHEVTPEAARFRDMSKKEQNTELAIKIGLAAGAVVLLIATAIAIHYCVKSTYTYTHRPILQDYRGCYYGAPVTKVGSYAPLAVFPGVFGGAGVIGLTGGAIFVDLEQCRNGFSKDLSPAGAAEQELFILTSENLASVKAQYYVRDGGVVPLVRNGLITEEQGRGLSKLMKDYHEQSTLKTTFEGQGRYQSAFSQDLKAHPEKYPVYQAIQKQLAQLEGQWQALQQAIKEQYSSEE